MNLNQDFGVSLAKVADLRARFARLGIDPGRIEEKYVKGSGPGGSKTNKAANAVVLRYEDVTVRCRRDRRLAVNRFLALRELVERLEATLSPDTAPAVRTSFKRRESIRRASRRARARHRRIREEAGEGE